MDLHPSLAHLAGLVGTWRGRGRGEYPTITGFDYEDEVRFQNIGKPFLLFTQRTTIGGVPMHTETGYWRAPTTTGVEVVIAIPTGQAELGVGTCTIDDDGVLTITTEAEVANAPTAKRVDRIRRLVQLAGDALTYDMEMAAVGQPMLLHLRSALHRAD